MFAITIPDGVSPGDAICVEIQDDLQEGSRVVMLDNNSVVPADGEEDQGNGSQDKKPISKDRASLGAAAVGGVIGCLLIGPITGVVVAGVALYATTRDDGIGNAARATGSAAVAGFDKAKDAAEKNHVFDKLKVAGAATAKKAGEINEQYHITGNIKAATKSTVSEASRLNQKYDITGKAARGVMSGASAVGKLVSGNKSSTTSASNPNEGVI